MNIEGFEILDKIEESSKTVTWKAHQKALARYVAIRVLKPKYETDPKQRAAFLDTAKAASKLKHPNIVQIYDVSDGATCYSVQEFVNGKSVAKLIDEKGTWPQKKAFEALIGVADALGYAWDTASIIHRNIKPDNLFLDDDGTVKIADWGLSKVTHGAYVPSPEEAEFVEGTPNYMSPEQIEGNKPMDFRTDMYSLGASLYHILTGTSPFHNYNAMVVMEKHLHDFLPNPKEINPSLSNACVDVLTKLMMKSPSDRYPTWHEAHTEMENVAAGKIILRKEPITAVSTIASSSSGPGTRMPLSNPFSFKEAQWNVFPKAVRALAWILLLGWLALLGQIMIQTKPGRTASATDVTQLPAFARSLIHLWHFCTDPFISPLPAASDSASTPAPDPQTTPAASTSPDPATPRSSQAPASNGETRPTAVTARDTTQTEPSTPGEETKTSEETTPETAEPAVPVDTVATIANQITHDLIAQRFPAALTAIRNKLAAGGLTPDEATAIQNMEKMVVEAAKTDGIVAKMFSDNIGQTMTIRIRGQNLQVAPLAVAGSKITAILVRNGTDGRAQTNTVSFSTEQLDPLQKSTWLGAADSPAKAAAKCLLHIQGADFETARTLAASCGPLQAPLSTLTRTRPTAPKPR